DLPLTLRASAVHRHGWHAVGGVLLLQQDARDLRSVAVRDDEPDTAFDEVGEHFGRRRDGGAHGGYRAVIAGGAQRVAAQRDNTACLGAAFAAGHQPARAKSAAPMSPASAPSVAATMSGIGR